MDRIIGRTGMEYRETASEEFQIPDQRTDRKLTFSFRLRVPAQLVDATPCRTLLRQRSWGEPSVWL
jgi:hypothetical protein